MKQLLPLVLALSLCACATTKPLDAADIRYSLPRTDVAATLTVKVRGCEPLAADTSLSLAPKAGAQKTVYEIPGEALVSGRLKRGLKISLNSNGAIKGVNAATSDRTPQIIGNYVKVAATLASGFKALPPPPPPSGLLTTELKCRADVAIAAKRAAVVRSQIRLLRTRLGTSASNSAPGDKDLATIGDINKLARELAGLEKILTSDIDFVVALDAGGTEANVVLDPSDFASLFDVGDSRDDDQIAAEREALKDAFGLKFSAKASDEPQVQKLNWTRPSKAYREPCDFWMAVPRTKVATVTVEGRGTFTEGKINASRELAVAQWSEPAKLCLDAAFGETKALELAYDDYGRVTDYNWTSESSGEAISGALAGAAPDVVSFGKALRSPTALETMTAEANTLEMGQKLHNLRACQVILDAGGECPKE